MAAGWLRAASFPVKKSLSEFDLPASSVPRPTLEYRPSLEWLRATEWQCLAGLPGTGKSHVVMALGHAAADAGYTARFVAAAELVESLYRGLADTSVDKVVESTLRPDAVIVDQVGFAPLDDTGPQLLSRFVAAANQRRAVATAGHWAFEERGRFLPNETTAVSLLDRLLHHSIVVVTEGESLRMREARQRGGRKAKAS